MCDGPWFPASRSYDPSLVFLYFVNPAAAMSLFPRGVVTAGAQITRSTASPVSGCTVSGASVIDCRTSNVRSGALGSDETIRYT